MVIDALPQGAREKTLNSLAQLMGLQKATGGGYSAKTQQQILNGTLVRKIEHFNAEQVTRALYADHGAVRTCMGKGAL